MYSVFSHSNTSREYESDGSEASYCKLTAIAILSPLIPGDLIQLERDQFAYRANFINTVTKVTDYGLINITSFSKCP
jgi:hypothetical protein